MATNKDLTILQGSAFSLPVRWMNGDQIVRKPITAISIASGAPRLTVASHGLSNGWPSAVTLVKGMTQINAQNSPPKGDDYQVSTVIDANVIEYNAITPVDANGREWPAYTSGGFVQWYAPMSLAGKSARMTIRDKIGGTVLASTEVAHAPLNVITATVDSANNVINIAIPATATDDFAWKKGVYDIEVYSTAADAQRIVQGEITVSREVTT
jgi:hypothetical protein